MFVVVRDTSSVRPRRVLSSAVYRYGQCGEVASSLVRRWTSVVSSLPSVRPVRCHVDVRANPCIGSIPAVRPGPNHGQQTGTPARIERPGASRRAVLT